MKTAAERAAELVVRVTAGAPASPGQSIDREESLVEALQCVSGSGQVIVVTNKEKSSCRAKLTMYEKLDGKWTKVISDVDAAIGKNGFRNVKNFPLSQDDKKVFKYEGDGCSPSGAFAITRLFGWGKNPGFSLPYRKTTSDDYWVSGNSKEQYNVWTRREGGPDEAWGIYESLRIPCYKYAAVIEYNTGPDRIVGNGSAIFLHIADNRGYTSGCTAVSEEDLLEILVRLKPECKPVIVQGTEDEIRSIDRIY